VHHLEEVRMKAIRLVLKHIFPLKILIDCIKAPVLYFWLFLQVANKLYPLSPISKQIEDFAKEMLISVMSSDASETTDAEGSNADSQKVFTFL
jgi:symplekin